MIPCKPKIYKPSPPSPRAYKVSHASALPFFGKCQVMGTKTWILDSGLTRPRGEAKRMPIRKRQVYDMNLENQTAVSQIAMNAVHS